MYTQIYTIIMLCYGCLEMLTFGRACPYQECVCADADIVCQDRNLNQIPEITNTQNGGYMDLNLGTNNITHISAGRIPPGLYEIYLLQNPTTTIDDAAFDASASTLESLSFSQAHFTSIPNALLHLKALKYLSIQDTDILDWNENVMINISLTLDSLILENVGLTAWPTWMRYFSHLTELSLSSNSISSIPDTALDQLTNSLTSLSLFNNSLTTVPKAVSNLVKLQMLRLHENRITDLTWLPQASKLTSLSLNDNKLTDANHLSDSLRHYADSLSDIDIYANQLTTFPNFSFLTQVESLDFSNNRISDPNSGSLPISINTLNLKQNSLPFIPTIMTTLDNVFEMFLSMNSIRLIRETDFSNTITGVYLGYNMIIELTDASFPENSIIATLQLNNNPLVTISNLAFINLHLLMELNLQSTQLTRLPLALSLLSSVKVVDFTNNVRLICTCNEKRLEPWVVSLQSYGIMGNCGQASIYYFFQSLSPSCPE